MSGERSAEFCRWAVEALNRAQRDFTVTVPELQAEYLDLLASAEAREAAQPTAAEVVEACRVALERLEDLAYDWVNEAGSAAHVLANTAQHRAEAEARQEFEACRTAALALCARWKEEKQRREGAAEWLGGYLQGLSAGNHGAPGSIVAILEAELKRLREGGE
ncbi:hypothetical protein UFOVP836_15 [uncultured Caudovirales phage]|uniref:Uncharacterized protein n=1 Tax=uncultured Caudovirales phage TaxID=2100421 RepID=A0A6J5P3Z5_9CAUD|nr:hypothetical protein UFOVP836_15 [uncultured Caudovirales phage]